MPHVLQNTIKAKNKGTKTVGVGLPSLLLILNISCSSSIGFTNNYEHVSTKREAVEFSNKDIPQSAFTLSKLTIETLEQCVKYDQS